MIGGGGAIQAMITAIKNNSRQSNRKKFDGLGGTAEGIYKKSTHQKIHTVEEIEAAKAAFREKQRKRRHLTYWSVGLTIALSLAIVYGLMKLYILLFN
ncbi:hypothetical protein [Nonlabens xiamenensis]|uniref:hypothetical protein n=1 Tax=Nonlabens xiamenensis TaxID=2341043 RepID=UPI000F61461A|nr:hypothetical protein [Nonlabens xiamenensis]